MKNIKKILVLISVATVISGLVQLVHPQFVLNIIGAETGAAAAHFFRIIGMFMALFGGMLLHALYSEGGGTKVAGLWCAFQKLGAAIAVYVGIRNQIFSPLAGMVAGFDLLSGILIFWYWRKITS